MKSRIWTAAAIAVGVVAGASAAHSQQKNANTLLHDYDTGSQSTRSFLEAIVGANYDGMDWMNSYMQVKRGITPAFCPPGDVAFTNQQILELLRAAVQRSAYIGTLPYGQALRDAMVAEFPCPTK